MAKTSLSGRANCAPIADGQAEAHGAEAAGVDPEARLVEADELRGPHLVLADVAGDDGFAAGEAVDFGHQMLRLDLGVGLVGGRSGCSSFQSRICCHQARARPRRSSLAARRAVPAAACSASARTRFTSPTIGTSGVRFLPISAGSISTWMTLACGAKAARRPVTRSSKRTPRAISRSAFGHRHVGGVAAVHAGHADEVRMLARAGRRDPSACRRRARRSVSTNSRSSCERVGAR